MFCTEAECYIRLLRICFGSSAGGDSVCRNFIDKSVVLSGFFYLFLDGLLDFGSLGQGADGQGDLMLLFVDSGDFRFDNIADGKNIFRLADAGLRSGKCESGRQRRQ